MEQRQLCNQSRSEHIVQTAPPVGVKSLARAGLATNIVKKESAFGMCRLTRAHGRFVDSHIIPRALTRLSKTGEKYVETGIGLGIQRRANSWYDGQLVTQAGEDILSDIDSKAILDLRAHRLVWSGWEADETTLRADEFFSVKEQRSHRLVKIERPAVLQVFFLSLLWRAAASTRPEFGGIVLAENELEDLRRRVLSQDPGQLRDYPVQLFQIVTRGAAHNRTPLLERKLIIHPDLSTGPEIPYVRFYFDGLVSHIILARGHALGADYLSTCLGFSEDTIVFTQEFDQSRTAANIREMAITVSRQINTPSSQLRPTLAAARAAFSAAMKSTLTSTAEREKKT